jgi:hypothetical protein
MKLWGVLSFLLLLPSFLSAQARYESLFDSMLFTSAVPRLEEAIHETSRRHAIYSYNLANATTPGFEPILFEDDQRQLLNMVPENSEYFAKVVVEHMSAKMAVNRGRQQAYYALYKKMFDNYRQVVTLGKK